MPSLKVEPSFSIAPPISARFQNEWFSISEGRYPGIVFGGELSLRAISRRRTNFRCRTQCSGRASLPLTSFFDSPETRNKRLLINDGRIRSEYAGTEIFVTCDGVHRETVPSPRRSQYKNLGTADCLLKWKITRVCCWLGGSANNAIPAILGCMTMELPLDKRTKTLFAIRSTDRTVSPCSLLLKSLDLGRFGSDGKGCPETRLARFCFLRWEAALGASFRLQVTLAFSVLWRYKVVDGKQSD